MKRIFLLALVALISPGAKGDITHEVCSDRYDMAFQAMEKRQSDFSMSTVVASAKSELEKTIVRLAYRVPRQTARASRYTASVQYANQWANECYERLELKAFE
ncbi:hypothetical protein [Larsenimonas salina]|uniref:hypothetical protein n=1 Tax=Larsenimonas salina TaxID=1295565 RepID=UPI0020731191|nr:hypothetical protein [Larsenimonas salina]MCM5703630.1 hypothetical protein [Larsenimonas salina]